MTRMFFLMIAAAVTVMATGNATAAPRRAPNWDLDYQVWVGIPGWDYQLWIDPPNGRPYVYATYDTQNQANNDWFFLYEHNVIPAGSSVWTHPVRVTEWEYWDTYETWALATDSADDWQAIGFETDIRAVYGGPLVDLSPLMPGLARAALPVTWRLPAGWMTTTSIAPSGWSGGGRGGHRVRLPISIRSQPIQGRRVTRPMRHCLDRANGFVGSDHAKLVDSAFSWLWDGLVGQYSWRPAFGGRSRPATDTPRPPASRF